MDINTITAAIDKQSETIKTKNFDISFNELLDMYNSQELIISPDYQRMFRWSEEKQSMLIESLILEMPLPPIYVIEIEDRVYELIDGLQRISTYFHFRYDDIEDDLKEKFSLNKFSSPLALNGCDIVPELNGFTYDTLPRSVQLTLKRNFIRVEVLRKDTDANIRYHMFKRLNTGGELLTDQEIRNCTIRLLGNKFNDFIIKCSNNKFFKDCIENVYDKYEPLKKDQELVLRFFALKNNLDNYKKDLSFFLTKYMEDVTQNKIPFDYEYEEKLFINTFKLLFDLFQKNAFSSIINTENITYKSDFVYYIYDSFTCGIAKAISLSKLKNQEQIKQSLINLRKDKEFLKSRTGGKDNTYGRIELVVNSITVK